MSKYIELKLNIINYIREQKLKPNDLIPSTSGLEKLYHVSTITIRKAIDELVNEGVLYRVHGKGTYVAEQEERFLEIYNLVTCIFPDNVLLNLNSLFPSLLNKLEKKLFKNKMEMIISAHNYNPKAERQIINHLLKRDVDGVIMNQSGCKENIPYYSQLANKVSNSVFIDTYIPEINSNFVVTDNKKASYELCEKLCGNNIKKLYYISYSEVSEGTSVKDRYKGVLECMSQHKDIELITLNYDRFISYDDFSEKMTEFFAKENLSDNFGIFTINSINAFYLYQACKDILNKYIWHFATFEKLIDDYPETTKRYWAEQDMEKIAENVMNILKVNPMQKQHIYVPAIIHDGD